MTRTYLLCAIVQAYHIRVGITFYLDFIFVFILKNINYVTSFEYIQNNFLSLQTNNHFVYETQRKCNN